MSFEDLYPKALMQLAAAAHGAGRLPTPTASVTRVNPLCGDRIDLDLQIRDHVIQALGYEVKACVLCQASASLLGETMIGKISTEVQGLRSNLKVMLEGDGPPPGPPFAAFGALTLMRQHKSRHGCVLLPIDALLEAINA